MLRFPNDQFFLCVTRYNNETWNKSVEWCNNHNFYGCIYKSPRELSSSVPFKAKLFILEMNNDIEKIMGIGYLYNHPRQHSKYNIYPFPNQNFNRYTYISKHRVDRDDIPENMMKTIHMLENMVFKGKTHLKRGQGIQRVPQKLIDLHKKDIFNLLCFIFLHM